MSGAGQAEVDRLWEALSESGQPMQCGWLTDRYGVPWQVVPKALGEMLKSGTPQQAGRVTGALLGMIKIDVAALEEAYRGAEAA